MPSAAFRGSNYSWSSTRRRPLRPFPEPAPPLRFNHRFIESFFFCFKEGLGKVEHPIHPAIQPSQERWKICPDRCSERVQTLPRGSDILVGGASGGGVAKVFPPMARIHSSAALLGRAATSGLLGGQSSGFTAEQARLRITEARALRFSLFWTRRSVLTDGGGLIERQQRRRRSTCTPPPNMAAFFFFFSRSVAQ